MAVLAGRLVASRDPGTVVLLVPLILEAGIYLFLLNKLAHLVTRSVHRNRRRAGAVRLKALTVCLAWTVLPVNAFDCMDGQCGQTMQCVARVLRLDAQP